MKKLLPAVIVILLLLTGCQTDAKSKTQPLPAELSAEVEIKTNYGSYKALLEHTDVWTRLTYYEPEAINGLTLTKTANGCTAELAGLMLSSNENYFTKLSAVYLIDEVLKAALYGEGEELKAVEFEESVLISGEVDGKPFELVRYKAEPKIISISIPSCSLDVKFT